MIADLFGLSAPVSRRFYAAAGVALMLLKYGIDAAVVYLVTGTVWSPLAYLSPMFFLREAPLLEAGAPRELTYAMIAWSLPFLWVGVSMSIRRAADAGYSGWLGLAFFVPVLNYVFMLVMCLLPSHPRIYTDPEGRSRLALADPVDHGMRSALLGIAAGLGIALLMVGISVFIVGHYGASLFLGTPFVIGAATAFLFNRRRAHSVGATIGVVSASVLMAAGALLLFALEGFICIAMATPLAYGAALLGGLAGRAMAIQGAVSAPAAHLLAVVAALPFLAGFEAKTSRAPLREVLTVHEIDAPPAAVWPHVVGFTELPAPAEWFFRLGIAFPQRARIEGHGPGAIRHCEFSTGAFVEPITVWDEPSRLAFDVVSQPPPMHEWSPYRHVHPPHLDGTMRSRRGEFRLIPLGANRTRVEARTWYELELFPQAYWSPWSDALIGAIHARVLRHIAALSAG